MKFIYSSVILASSIASVAAQDDSCDAEYIVEACLESTQAKVSACSANDWSCLCTSYTDVLTCYNNCPNDSRAPSVQNQVTSYCGAASAASSLTASVTSSTSGSVASSVAASTSAATASASASGTATSTEISAATASSESGAEKKMIVGGAAVLAAIAAMI